MTMTTAGDSALILRVCEDSEVSSKACAAAVLGVYERLRMAEIPGVIELAPAYASVGIFYDPLLLGADSSDPIARLTGQILSAVRGRNAGKRFGKIREVKIPVCYDRAYAPDLDDVSAQTRLTAKELISRHSSAEYLVRCVGFTPGFPYLTGLPTELALPRRATPRKEVPAGSVAIGGAQTGIYPSVSPGGWNLIGRTPLRLFSIERAEPSLLRAGDRVRFVKITAEQFEGWKE